LPTLAGASCVATSEAKKPAKAAAAAETGIDETAIDKTVNPCDDFYQYACGNWLKRTEIPADKSAWGRGFSVIDERNEDELHKILDDATQGKGPSDDKYIGKIGDLYASCMDEAGIEQKAPAELKAELAKVDAVKNATSLVKEVAHVHLAIGSPMFEFGQEQDFKNATQVIGALDQGGLGLPDRDYYVQTTGKFPEIRKQYEAHVEKMLTLAGEKPAAAKKDAATVMRIETGLAQASMSRVDRRDPNKVYHRIDLAGIMKTAPKWNWKLYLTEMGVPSVTAINVRSPEFFAALNKDLSKIPMADWKAYLRWHVVHNAAPALPKAFVDENFAFYGKTLNGTAELEPRWKSCVKAVDRLMGEALGKAFVDKTFGAEGKLRTQMMVREIEEAMNVNLDGLKWFDDATRKQAHEKLAAIANKIGYPDKWRNYDALEIKRDSYFGNALRADAFETKRQLDKIGKPLDRSEWGMTPPTVNAYYDPSMNEMVFPAGILQPPFFNKAAMRAVNYGAIGMVMGHELTHGFDDEGRRFDGAGNLRDWWTKDVGKKFDDRAECVARQYSGYSPVEDVHLNGKLTLGENTADNGGVRLSFMALQERLKEKPQGLIDGFTPEQRFFLGYAQVWCENRTPQSSRLLAATDPHSPGRYRVNGVVQNSPEFQKAYGCKAGQPMVSENACRTW
jgi:endothelin-converting enzyme/putative endopeptidase